jgi:hypothetical protein
VYFELGYYQFMTFARNQGDAVPRKPDEKVPKAELPADGHGVRLAALASWLCHFMT